jgi:transcriptional regulator with XRE-family HTH domain
MTQTAIEVKVASRLQAARKEAKLTYRQIAEQLGVDQRTVAGWMAKDPRSSPSYERLLQLARVLNKPIHYFLEERAA